jgi:serine/threonine protein kinase
MAELYLARHSGEGGFEKVVAIKRVLPHLGEDPDFIEMFRNEARLAATLHHPNIAQVFDVGVADGEHFYALEYVHGRNLLQVLKMSSDRPLSIADGLTIIVAVASALHHAHEQTGPDGRPMGIVHRDVTPSNVMVSYTGAVKLTDFGIARAAERTSTTRAGTIKGKAGYMSPEQARGEIIDRRSDVFSLGIMLYEVTTGARAFYAPNDYAVMGKVARGDYLPPRELDPDYPAALERIVKRALAVDPDQRYDSAEALQMALESFSHDSGVRLSSLSLAEHMKSLFGTPAFPSIDVVPILDDVEPVSRGRSMIVPALLGAGLLVAGVGLGATVFGGQAPEPAPPAVPSPQPEVVPAAPALVPVPVEVGNREPSAKEPVDALPQEPSAESASAEPEVVSSKPGPTRRPGKKKARRGKRAGKKAEPPKTADREALYPPGYDQ